MPPATTKPDRLSPWDWVPFVIWNEVLVVVVTVWELGLLLHGRLVIG